MSNNDRCLDCLEKCKHTTTQTVFTRSEIFK